MMMNTNWLVILLLLLSACNQPQKLKPVQPKGELAFLLQYNNQLPGDVGFMTNHIMERRVSNLLKERYEAFMLEQKEEQPLQVDTVLHTITSRFTKPNQQLLELILVDVANDALWIDYYAPDTVLHYADRVSIERPE